ncbi:carboxymuconolactone decarboxylase family protein [Halorarum salinum]|uniref:Carboxymuconolactone decarboxylase family protein n=1 Tax=Halorarum salinum TaxID=2743089 RepID=A0A7D5LDA0_9EURY|nr:carboxymuconolactone decarboxylase family protein [Halobaculum salinum]QLG63667.1 carboxymuconolactone decarboxylase family protein [Halobaculum salinum]
MASRLDIVTPGESDDEAVNELLREAEEGWYEDAAFFGAMAHQPRLFKRIASTLEAFPASDSLDPALLELMRLRVAVVHRCAYCATVRTRGVRDDVAPREDAVLGEDVGTDALTRREELAVRVADLLSRDPHRLSDEFFEDLQGEFTDRELVELLLFASLEVGLDRFTVALRLDTAEGSPYPTPLTYPFDP